MSAETHEANQLQRELRQLRQRVRELEQKLAERGRHSARDIVTSGATLPREVTVLIVDDDDAKRYIWARALSSAGLRVMEAANGREALLSLGRETPDLVLLDVNLPDTTGFDLCDRIKSTAATEGTPVVLVSAVFTSGRDHVRGLGGGAEAYLSGEVDPDVVVATVRALIGMHRAEAALRESEARFRAMFSLAAVGMGQTDASGRLVAVNPKLCEMLGYTESELIGRLFTEMTHPEDVEESRRLMRDLWAGVIDDFAIYKRYVRKDGALIWGHATVSLVPEIAGTERRTVAVIRDVTARVLAEQSLRESEARYRRFASVVESSTDAIIAKDLDEIVLSWNSGAERMYGYTAEEAVGRPISSLIMPPDAQQEWTSLNKRALGGELVQDYDTVRVRKDGTRISVALTLWPLTDEDGTVVGTSSIARDMSVRHQAMKEKEDALALVSALTNAAPVGLAFFDCDLRYRLVNEHLANMNGISAEAHLGHTVAELLPGMDEFARRMYNLVVETGRPVLDEEVAVVMPNHPGELRHLSESWYPVHSRGGTLLGVGAVVVDTTERRRLEEAVRMSEERLRIALDAASMGTWTVDPATGKVHASERSRVIHGFAETDLDFESAVSAIHPQDRERVAAAIRRSIEERVPYDQEYRVTLPGGERRWIASWGRLMEASAGALIFGIAQDISGRKQAEEDLLDSQRRIRDSELRFRRLAESNIIGIVSADVDGVKTANDVFLHMIGASRQELEAGSIDWVKATPPDQLHKDLQALAELREKGWCKPYEKEYVHPDGSRTPILIGAAALETEPLEWICFALDLTEQKALETRLRETQKLESIGLLAGGIAHDFNNLLVGIIGNASLGQDIVPPRSPVRPVLDAIVKAGERAAHLTREMLAYSGKGRFVLEQLDMSETVRDVTSLLHSSIPSRVTVQFDLAPGLPRVEADPGQMQQLIMNLVLNAAEAVTEGHGTVSIRTGVRSVEKDEGRVREFPDLQPGDYVSIEVSDTGCGMDAETREKIFDPFFTTKFTGRGLGLAAVAGIVRGHNGAIQVTTVPGAGSAFLVLLPAASAIWTEPGAPEAAQPDLHGAGVVLVVDDEEVVRDTARIALERQGYTVLLADSGPDAIDIFAREAGRILVVLLDLGMPGMDGQQTLRELQKIRADVHALISSGYTEAECLRLFAGEKICGFVEKPYTSARLASKVKTAMSAAA